MLEAASVPCVAVVQSLEERRRSSSLFVDDAPLRGAHRALVELGLHHDIVLGELAGSRLLEYELVVLPEQRPSPELAELLREYLSSGGAVLATFSAAEDRRLAEALGLELAGYAAHSVGYVLPSPALQLPAPVFVRGRFARVRVSGAEVLGERADPYSPPALEGLPYEDWLGAGYGSPSPPGSRRSASSGGAAGPPTWRRRSSAPTTGTPTGWPGC